MFDKLKNLSKVPQLQRTQNEIKKQLEQIFVTMEKGKFKVVIRGDKKIEKLEIDGQDNKDLRDLINDAVKDIDKKVEKKMGDQLRDVWGDLSKIL